MEVKYRIPFPKETKWKETKSKGRFAHENFDESKYAKDLLVELGTPVIATRTGIVWKTKSDSQRSFHPKNLEGTLMNKIHKIAAQFTNYVCIEHGDGTYAEYIHLDREVRVVEGDKVRRGKIIGYVGMSGITSEPHLHFNVFRIENSRGVSIPFEWEDSV